MDDLLFLDFLQFSDKKRVPWNRGAIHLTNTTMMSSRCGFAYLKSPYWSFWNRYVNTLL